jgi:hypothetical protein
LIAHLNHSLSHSIHLVAAAILSEKVLKWVLKAPLFSPPQDALVLMGRFAYF